MITYLVKVILFSGLLMLIYTVFLEKEKMHRFKRFYLLGCTIFPFLVPLIPVNPELSRLTGHRSSLHPITHFQRNEISEIIQKTALRIFPERKSPDDGFIQRKTLTEKPEEANSQDAGVTRKNFRSNPPPEVNEPGKTGPPVFESGGNPDYFYYETGAKAANPAIWARILIITYLIVSVLLLSRFGSNISKFYYKIKSNRLAPYHDAKLVLINEPVIPHSFLNYIFVNTSEYENGNIDLVILYHELTHIRQKHTLDLLFLELIIAIAWINPFLIFYRRAVRLNHEYLADEKVVSSCCDIPTYQLLLFEKIRQEPGIAISSPFNYLTTKKRFIMMGKKYSLFKAVSKQVILIPALGLSALIFMNSAAVRSTEKTTVTGQGPESGSVISPVSNQDPESRPTIQAPPPIFADDFVPSPPTGKDLRSVMASHFLVYIDGWIVDNSVLEYYEEIDFAHHSLSRTNERSVYQGKFDSTAVFYTHIYYNRHRRLAFEEQLPSGSGVQPEQIMEYERIIEKYTPPHMSGSEQTRNIHGNISSDEMGRLVELYKNMSLEQRREQKVIFISPMGVSRNIPTRDQLSSFSNPEKYGVWVDSRRIDNTILADYTNTDFAHFSVSRLLPNATNYGKHDYQVNLMTRDYYNKFRESFSEHDGYRMIYRIQVSRD